MNNHRIIAATTAYIASMKTLVERYETWREVVRIHENALRQFPALNIEGPGQWPQGRAMLAAIADCDACKAEWNAARKEIHGAETIMMPETSLLALAKDALSIPSLASEHDTEHYDA